MCDGQILHLKTKQNTPQIYSIVQSPLPGWSVWATRLFQGCINVLGASEKYRRAGALAKLAIISAGLQALAHTG